MFYCWQRLIPFPSWPLSSSTTHLISRRGEPYLITAHVLSRHVSAENKSMSGSCLKYLILKITRVCCPFNSKRSSFWVLQNSENTKFPILCGASVGCVSVAVLHISDEGVWVFRRLTTWPCYGPQQIHVVCDHWTLSSSSNPSSCASISKVPLSHQTDVW